MLLSAGLPLPTASWSTTTSPSTAGRSASRRATPSTRRRWSAAYGTDAVRWWLLREVARVGDTDFTAAPAGRPRQRGPRQRPRQPGQPHGVDGPPLPRRRRPVAGQARTERAADGPAAATGGATIDAALADFDFRRGGRGGEGDRRGGQPATSRAVRPWELAKAERSGAVHRDPGRCARRTGRRPAWTSLEHLTPFLPRPPTHRGPVHPARGRRHPGAWPGDLAPSGTRVVGPPAPLSSSLERGAGVSSSSRTSGPDR